MLDVTMIIADCGLLNLNNSARMGTFVSSHLGKRPLQFQITSDFNGEVSFAGCMLVEHCGLLMTDKFFVHLLVAPVCDGLLGCGVASSEMSISDRLVPLM